LPVHFVNRAVRSMLALTLRTVWVRNVNAGAAIVARLTFCTLAAHRSATSRTQPQLTFATRARRRLTDPEIPAQTHLPVL
jgi:hypothetical protein